MRMITFFAPPAAFFLCAILGVVFHKSWMGILLASVVFYAAAFALTAVLNRIMERKQKSN
jgi:positive regulator of sigma E activity